ncbi:hypothetical protein LDL59_07830 [Kaistella anthropi]|nr:hypothetical protein [Kaistella anthropi]
MDSIKVFAPATVANVVCGYDVLGFAIQEPGDEIILKKNDSNQIVITKIEGDNGKLPKDLIKMSFRTSLDYFWKKSIRIKELISNYIKKCHSTAEWVLAQRVALRLWLQSMS